MSTTKLPTDIRPLVRDPELVSALERELAGLSGEKLARAQEAVRRVRGSGVQGMFEQVLAAYQGAISDAVSAYEAEQKAAEQKAAEQKAAGSAAAAGRPSAKRD